MRIILASSSPRRKYLLNMLLRNFGLKFEIIPANIREYIHHEKSYSSLVKSLALEKANAVADNEKGLVISADTIVVLNSKVLGKPENRRDAVRMLQLLSGKEHKVYTGICFVNRALNISETDYEMTKVKFRNINIKEINFYVESGSPMDKAGAYGIQDDFGSTFVEKIKGDYFNVVGLPVVKTYLHLQKILKLNK
jgi:septum formation protein